MSRGLGDVYKRQIQRLAMMVLYLQVYFEALKGNGYMGDIALDDIVVYQGPCPAPGNFFSIPVLVRLMFLFRLFVAMVWSWHISDAGNKRFTAWSS